MYIFRLKIMKHEIYFEILMPTRKISCSYTLIDEIIFKKFIQGGKDKY